MWEACNFVLMLLFNFFEQQHFFYVLQPIGNLGQSLGSSQEVIFFVDNISTKRPLVQKNNRTLDHPGETIIAVRCARYTLPFVHHFCVTQGHPTWLMATSAWFFLRQHQGLELRDERRPGRPRKPHLTSSFRLRLLVSFSHSVLRWYYGNSNLN